MNIRETIFGPSTIKALGTALIVIAFVGFYGWINATEPDCFYSFEVGLQIRLCGENYVGRAESAKLWVPAVCLVLLVAGIALRVRSRFMTDQ